MSQESFLSKLFTQIKGNAHDLVDKLSDPNVTARQLVRDMGVTIEQADEALVDAQGQLNLFISARDKARDEVEKYQNYAKKALATDNEALAREALAEKAKHQDALDKAQAKVDQYTPVVDALKERINELRSRRDDAEARTGELAARSALATAEDKVNRTLDGIGSGSSASAAFDRLEAKLDKQEANNKARADIAKERRGVSVDDKFAALDKAGKASVDDELAALKAQMGK